MIKPYFETELGKLYNADCLDLMPELEPVDLIVTSPPYDSLRKYKGYKYNFIETAHGLVNIITDGGVLVWIIADETVNGNESGTSFENALLFKRLGLKLHDTMIYEAMGTGAKGSNLSYWQAFEYMFVFAKGKIKTVNRIADHLNVTAGGKKKHSPKTEAIGTRKEGGKTRVTPTRSVRTNIWRYAVGQNGTDHPAPFPTKLAIDHIQSWSNEGHVVADIMTGSGTVPVACERLKRKWIGIEISEEYCEISAKRIEREIAQNKLPGF